MGREVRAGAAAAEVRGMMSVVLRVRSEWGDC